MLAIHKNKAALADRDVARELSDEGAGEPPLEFARERGIIARLSCQLYANMTAAYFPGDTGYHSFELTYVMLQVVRGHLERRPVTVALLTKRLGVSEKTARRWLAELVQSGHAIRRTRGYWCTDRVNDSAVCDAIGRNIKLLNSMAAELGRLLGVVPAILFFL